MLKEITAFANKVLWRTYLFSDKEGKESFIMAQVTDRPGHHCADELWSFALEKRELRRICAGSRLSVSPDRSMATFMKSDEDGFHSIHLMDIATGQMEPILSLWESDPGSGIGWDSRWSVDSRAVNISGTCGGFYHGKGMRLFWRSKQFNYLFMVKEKRMFSL
jgi:hypothetical protein